MIVTTRRAALAGALAAPALAAPTLAAMPKWRWQHGEGAVLLHDPSLGAGRRFAEAGRARGAQVVELAGDRILLARQVLAGHPAMLVGISLSADALLVEEVAREAGYTRVALLGGAADCALLECRPGWQALGTLATGAGAYWVEALADFAVSSRGTDQAAVAGPAADSGPALGWVLARGV